MNEIFENLRKNGTEHLLLNQKLVLEHVRKKHNDRMSRCKARKSLKIYIYIAYF